MANTSLIKRSSVASKVPTTSDLSLGELAVNTYDGKLFLKKSVSGTESIVDLTNADKLDGQHGSYYTGYTDTAISNLIDSSPAALNTLNELAAALNDDANFSTTVTNSIATKLPLAGGTLTGNLEINTTAPLITFNESGTSKIYNLVLDGSALSIRKDSNAGSNIVQRWNSDGHVDFLTNVDFASGIDVTGDINGEAITATGLLKISNIFPRLLFEDTNNNDDFSIYNANGTFRINDDTNNAPRLDIASDGTVDIFGNLDVGAGLDVTGTCTATTFSGSGASLTNIPAAQLTGVLPALDGSNLTGLTVNNANTLDNLDSTQFVRSDANDTATGQLTLSGGISTNGKDIYTNLGAFISNDSNGAFATRNGSNIDHIWHDDAPGTGGTGGTWHFVSDGTYKSNGNSTIRASRYVGSGESLSFGTTQISFAGGIDVGGGGTAASGGITGSNYNITGVNAITFNDPGEGIIFKSGIELLLIDDANDNILNFVGAAELRVNNSKVWTASNDGSGSGLDADSLDGQQGSYYRNATNLNAGTIDDARLPATITSNITGNSGSTDALKIIDTRNDGARVPNDYAAHKVTSEFTNQIINGWWSTLTAKGWANGYAPWQLVGYSDTGQNTNLYVRFGHGGNNTWSSLYKIFHSGNDGSGSGLDADTVDGIEASSFLRSDASDTLTGGTYTFNSGTDQKLILAGSNDPYIRFQEGTTNKAYIQWHSSGFIRLVNDEDGGQLRVQGGTNGLKFYDGSTLYSVWHQGNDGSGSGLDADSLDGVQGSSYLRSDANDTTTGNLSIIKTEPILTLKDTNITATEHPTINFDTNNNQGVALYHSEFDAGLPVAGYGLVLDKSASNTQTSGTTTFTVLGNIYTGAGTMGSVSRVLTTADEGSGNGLDADLWDGNQFASYLDQALLTSSTVSFDRLDISGNHGIDNAGWFRNDSSGKGLYNTATTQHFYSDDDNYWNIAGGTDANGLRFRDESGGTIRGYVYANNSNQIGFLNQSGSWTVRTETVGITKLGSAGNGYQIRDGNVANNLYIYTAATGTASAGISVFNADGAWRFQLYGSSSAYGFLDGNWNGWDIKKTPNGNFEVDEGSGLQRVWNAGNDGSGSGLDSDTVDSLHVHTGNNTEANKIVRTDSNGYIFTSFINTTSNDTGVPTDVTRFYCSEDNYIRYIDKASMRTVMNVSALSSTYAGREKDTGNQGYWVGSQGWSNESFSTTVWDYGSCFFDVWSNPSGQPSGTSHWQGFQAMHYTDTSARYGMRITAGAGQTGLAYIGGIWNTTTYGWHKLWNEGNDGSGSGLDADTVDGLSASQFIRSDDGDTITKGSTWVLNHSIADWGFRFSNGNGTNAHVYMMHGTHGMHIRNDSSTTGQYLLDVYGSNGNRFRVRGGDALVTSNGNTMWHAGNDGSGSGLDADKLDGVEGSNYLRSNVGDTLYGTLKIALRNDSNPADESTSNLILGRHTSGGNEGGQMSFCRSNDNTVLWHFDCYGSNNQPKLRMHRDGAEVFSFNYNGNFYRSGSTLSDRDLKENIQDLTGTSLNQIILLTPRTFNFKESENYLAVSKTGFIAQEVAAVMPSLVNGTDGEKDMGVDFDGIVAHLVNSVKELKTLNDSLKARIEALES